MMTYINNEQIKELKISPADALAWVKEAFEIKSSAILPPKTSIAWEDHFMNTMPVSIPSLGIMGCKMITRFGSRTPTIDGHILLYDQRNGDLKCIMEAAEVTSFRTGAVCALAVKTLATAGASTIAIMGLGQTARKSLVCLREVIEESRTLRIKLMRYKDQHGDFMRDFSKMENVTFKTVDNCEDWVRGSDVIISCITHADKMLTQPEWYKPGCLLVPVHTKGFQNCDPLFDKVFADDTGHVKHFKHFHEFRKYGEIGDVLRGNIPGRESDRERIISYNIGIALHDLIFAYHIRNLLKRE